MSTNHLRASAAKVQHYLKSCGFDMNVIELPGPTRTAREAADNVGCAVAQIAKSLVFKDKMTREPILIIASGSNRVDMKKLTKATGRRIGWADGNWVKAQVGFAIGGIPPAGHTKQLTTFLDPDLKQYQTIWAAAGTPYALFKLTPDALEKLTKGTWTELAED